MANCQKNTNYLIKDASGQQIRDIRLSSDGKQLEIFMVATGNTECTFNIDSASSTGLVLLGVNLQIIDTIDGLPKQDSEAAAKAKVRIETNDATSALEIIGINDTIMSMQANIRYDAVKDEVTMEYQ